MFCQVKNSTAACVLNITAHCSRELFSGHFDSKVQGFYGCLSEFLFQV